MTIFDGQPPGYVLSRADGTVHNKIRGDLIPHRSIVIIQDDRHFVRTWEKEPGSGFWIYREGHQTYRYGSDGN